VKISILLTISN